MPRLDPIGETIDKRFRIVSSLGEGGFASVYLAEQLGMNRRVAVKFLHMESVDDDDLLERFNREAKILATLNHKNIVACYAYGLWRNRVPYLVLEYLEGETLHHKLSREKCLRWDEAFRYGVEVCQALTELHNNQIIHRDLKPENIMLTSDGRLKIIDFGLAAVDGQRLTQAGMLVGSLFYLSPEQATASEITSRTDIYSLGCVLYRCIAGFHPFDGTVPVEVMYKHLHEVAPSLRDCNSQIPLTVANIIAKAMSKEPTDRFKSAMDFAVSLSATIQAETRPVTSLTLERSNSLHSQKKLNPLSSGQKRAAVILLLLFVGALSYYPLRMLVQWCQSEFVSSRVRDELENSHMARLIGARDRLDLLAWAETSDLALPETIRMRADSLMGRRDRVAQLKSLGAAIKLGTDANISAELRAELLQAQVTSWLLGHVAYTYEDLSNWLDDASKLTSQLPGSSDTRNNIELISAVVGRKLSKHLMPMIQASLNANIIFPWSTEVDAELLRRTERALAPLVKAMIPGRASPGLAFVTALADYSLVLSGSNRSTEALILLSPFAHSSTMTSVESEILKSALAIAQFADGQSTESISTIGELASAAQGNRDFQLYWVNPTVLPPMRLQSNVPEGEKFVRVIQQLDTADGVPSAGSLVTVAQLHLTQGKAHDAMIELDKIEGISKKSQLSPDDRINSLWLRTLCSVAMGEIGEAERSLVKFKAFFDGQKTRPAVWSKQLNSLEVHLGVAKKLREADNAGLTHSKKAIELRNVATDYGFSQSMSYFGQNALANLIAIDKTGSFSDKRTFWCSLSNRLIFLERNGRFQEIVDLRNRYRSPLDALSRPSATWTEPEALFVDRYLHYLFATAYLQIGMKSEALKHARDFMQSQCDRGEASFPEQIGQHRYDYLRCMVDIAGASKSIDPQGSKALAALIADALSNIPPSLNVMGMTAQIAQLLGEQGFYDASARLFSRSDAYFVRTSNLPWRLIAMRRHCSVLAKAKRDTEASRLVDEGLALIGQSQSPLLHILHDEFTSLQKDGQKAR